MRLDKFLSHTGFGSRKEVKALLKKKQVSVNGVLAKDGKFNINEFEDEVAVSDEVVIYKKFAYYMLNKPKGVVSATEDNLHRTVLDLISAQDRLPGLFPVGRLDKDTTGLLLITNDGDLSHQLLSPKKKVPKLYEAQIAGIMTEEDVLSFSKGITISGNEECLPANLVVLSTDELANSSRVQLEIVEGKFHQVKRMVEAVGKKVVELNRLSMGGLTLDDSLKKGSYRELLKEELDELLKVKTK
ncbi:pseudouridine synthase [Vagococcus carniphilus]|uniref:Pseudouridine synthase n=1 Tax=Vagococcus carniphilus TaxID=218144 RepID=A0AAW8U2A1_9ENTE|nr:pseudouridine synthase [Vagococcus carniphilus]MDT2815295.1 pseudouridine synthase [Vagococcus carniphilus]MDT2832921.1 pseudouridine synthase [Vagococcus carniphilus]